MTLWQLSLLHTLLHNHLGNRNRALYEGWQFTLHVCYDGRVLTLLRQLWVSDPLWSWVFLTGNIPEKVQMFFTVYSQPFFLLSCFKLQLTHSGSLCCDHRCAVGPCLFNDNYRWPQQLEIQCVWPLRVVQHGHTSGHGEWPPTAKFQRYGPLRFCERFTALQRAVHRLATVCQGNHVHSGLRIYYGLLGLEKTSKYSS